MGSCSHFAQAPGKQVVFGLLTNLVCANLFLIEPTPREGCIVTQRSRTKYTWDTLECIAALMLSSRSRLGVPELRIDFMCLPNEDTDLQLHVVGMYMATNKEVHGYFVKASVKTGLGEGDTKGQPGKVLDESPTLQPPANALMYVTVSTDSVCGTPT